jgi:alanyl-tRNA synthetase
LGKKDLARRADQLASETGQGCAVVLAGSDLAVKLSPDLVVRGLNAGQIAQAACRQFGGGGGNAQFGQGGVSAGGHAAALAVVRTILGSSLEEG